MRFFAASNGVQPLKINDEKKDILFCKRMFSDVLWGITSTKFSGGKPPDSISRYMVTLEKGKIHFDLSAEIFYM